MRYSTPETEKPRSHEHRAAVFVDYENLFFFLNDRVDRRVRPEELITEMLDELRRYLLEEVRTQTALITAYADFSEMHGNGQFIQRALYLRGVEPRFVPATLQKNAAEIQLCVDAIDVLHNRPDIRTFIVVTGERAYLPLVQQFKRYGCQALIASLSPPPSTENLAYVEDDVFLHATNLLSEASRRAVSLRTSSAPAPSTPQRPQPVTHQPIEDEGARRALEIIEEYFGQYEEVYLTPLLRKLSELMDEEVYDPKTLISDLEAAGAVWLEKRRGFPYDYTVLLIDNDHPDVQEVQKAYYDREQHGYGPDDFDDEESDYYDDFDEYEDYEEPYPNGKVSEEEAAGGYEGDYADTEEEDESPR